MIALYSLILALYIHDCQKSKENYLKSFVYPGVVMITGALLEVMI